MGSDELVLHAADWQHQATQRELPGHGSVAPHRAAAEEADESNCQRDPCAGAVLRDCARRQVHCSSQQSRQQWSEPLEITTELRQ